MGYSITQRTHETLERRRREGRECRMSMSGHGLCRSRATVRIFYDRGEQPLQGCAKHAGIVLASPISDHLGPLTVAKVERF